MKSMLITLKKAVDRALVTEEHTREIALSAFPDYVITSLPSIVADEDESRAVARLALLKAQVDEALEVIKQGAGVAEDIESLRIRVAVFEEPGLTAKPTVEQEIPIIGADNAKEAQRAIEAPLRKAVETLRHEVVELRRALDAMSGERDEAMPANKAGGKEKMPDKETGKRKPGKESAGGTAKQEDDEEEGGKRKAGPKGTEKGAEQEDDDDEKGKKPAKGVAKSVSWPLDMNMPMQEAEPVAKSESELDWGPDPDLGIRARR